MKVISNEKTATNTVELEVQVSGEELQKAMNNVYEKERETINVPGFRKGKAPRKIIERMYGEAVFLEDAVNDIYPEAYAFAIDETGIEPVAPGDVEILTVDVNDGFTFKAVVTVKPEVTVKDYKGVEAEKVVRTVTDEKVEEEINRLRERGAREVDVEDRAAEDGDITIIDFEGFVEDEPFEGGKAEEHRLELGSNTFIDGFEEQIVGKNVGDSFDVEVTFPEEYHAQELAGKPAVFKVTLQQLKTQEFPELDDEFAKDVSEFDTLDELRADIRKDLQEQMDQVSQEELENSLVDVIVENLEGEIPEVMYEARIDQMMQEFAQRLSQQGMNMDLYLQYTGMDMESFRKTFRAQAERQVKIRLALEKIVELEDITPSEEDMEKEFENMSEMYGMPVEQLKELIRTEDLTADVAANLAVDLIRDSAKVTDISEEDFDARQSEEAAKEAARVAAQEAKEAVEAEKDAQETEEE